MESKIGWIDFSPSQKARVKRFMDMIDAGGMLDELGVGVIRDSISNEIFPGFSTLYTRAKYFFITPYILLDWYRKNHEQDGVEYFNEVEREVNKNISDYFKNLSDKNDESYFGKRTGGKLSRQPSEVYWNGIKRLKLVDSLGSLEQLLNQKPYAINELCSNERGNGVVRELGELGESSIVHVTPFTGWKDFINEHGLTLQEGEAETLKQHLLDNVPDSLPALLVSDSGSDSGIWEKYKEVKGKRIESGVLNNPMICFIEQVHSEIANSTLKENLIQAHNFSLFMYGPHIAYNISLRNKFGGETRDQSVQGLQIKDDLQRYGADVRFVENSANGGTTLLRCTHKRDKMTGEHTTSFRATSPGSRFPRRRFLRVRDEAPVFVEKLDFVPDVFFFDAAEAGLRYLAAELRNKGTLVYFEPESDADKTKFLKAVEVSDIVKFSHEKVGDLDFVAQNTDKLFIRTMGAEGLEFNLCGQGWVKIAPVPNDNVVDWEGAGDWTTSQFIACLCEKDMLSVAQMTAESVRSCLEIACRTASHSVSYMGSKGMIDVTK